jgi:hypothetical protein
VLQKTNWLSESFGRIERRRISRSFSPLIVSPSLRFSWLSY